MAETKTIGKLKTYQLPRINNELLRFKAFYFFCLSGFGSLMPYMPVYFRQMGLSASHVGFLIGIRPIVQFASAPFWAIMADRYKKRKPILVMSILAWLIMTLSLAFVEPTNQLCEMRIEYNSTLQFMNYTKLRTGFFRRSLAETRTTFAGKSGTRFTTSSIKTLSQNQRINLNAEDTTNKTMLTLKQRQKSSLKQTIAPAKPLQSRLGIKNKPKTLVNEVSMQRTTFQRNAGLPKEDDDISNKRKRLDDSKTRNTNINFLSQQKQKFHRSTIEFLRKDPSGDVKNSKIRIDHEGMTSESLEEPKPLGDKNMKNISIPKHVKDAADKLQKQFTKSINILSNLGKNSTATLLHHTSGLFSKKDDGKTVTQTETPKTIHQLHNAMKTFIKSVRGYTTTTNSEGSGATDEGSSSLLLNSDNDLSRLAMSHFDAGNGVDSQDNLHRIEPQQTYKGVMHNNVVPHHVLGLHHNTQRGVTVTEMLEGQDDAKSQSGSGSGEPPNVRQSILDDILGNITKAQKDNNTSNDVHTTNSSRKQTQQKFTKTFDSHAMPSALSEVMNHVNTTLTNLFKSNENEMSRIFVIYLVLIVVGEFLESPSATLADASLLEVLGEKRQFYGRQRLFGSIGFGICSFIVGIMLERSRHTICGEENVDYTICFCAFGIMMFMTFLVTSSFDFHYSDRQSGSASVLSALFNMHYGSCLVAACIMGIDFSMSHNFLAWLLEDLGGSKSLMGLAVISRCFADTITFYFAGSIIKRIGQVHVMIMVFISYTVILLTFSVIDNPAWVIPVEILDGVTYALAWSALTSYLASAVPPDSVTTIQGILQGVYWGLGSGSGAIVGGYLIHHLGVFQTFQFMAGLTLFACLIFSTVQWKWTSTAMNDQPQIKYTYLPTVETKDTDELLSRHLIPSIPTRIKGKFIKNTRK